MVKKLVIFIIYLLSHSQNFDILSCVMFRKRPTDRLGKKFDMLYEKKEIIMKKM